MTVQPTDHHGEGVTRWEAVAIVVFTPQDEQQINDLLNEGWEPYAATCYGMQGQYVRQHLRRADHFGSEVPPSA